MREPSKAANDREVHAAGRKDNAAQPSGAGGENAGVERYPPVSKDDSVDRTARPEAATGESRGSDPDPSLDQSVGSDSDPGEGKR